MSTRKMLKAVLLVVVSVIGYSKADWKPMPTPVNFYAHAFAASGTVIFAGDDRYVYRSEDHGKTWSQIPSMIPSHLNALVVCKEKLIAATANGFFSHSIDLTADSWANCNNGSTGNTTAWCFAADGDVLYGGTDDGIFRRIKDGDWEKVSDYRIPMSSVRYMAVADSHLYAASFMDSVFMSADSGKNWENVSNNFVKPLVCGLTSAGDALWTAVPDADENGVYMLLIDKTPSWINVTKSSFPDFSPVNISSNGKCIFAGTRNGKLLSSEDLGKSWVDCTPPMLSVHDQEVHVTVLGSHVMAHLSEGQLYQSPDLGKSWSSDFAGIPGYVPVAFASTVNTLFSTDGKSIKYMDDKDHWLDISGNFPSNLKINSLSTDNNMLIAGTTDALYDDAGGSGIFISANDGESWKNVNSGIACKQVTSIVNSKDTLFVGTINGIFRSFNNGLKWDKIINGMGSGQINVTALALSGNVVFASIAQKGMYVSSDHGTSWTSANVGLSSGYFAQSILITGNSVYTANKKELFLSNDTGRSWVSCKTGIEVKDSIRSILSFDNSIFALSDSGVFTKETQECSWKKVSSGLPQNTTIGSMVIRGTELYAAIEGIWHRPLAEMVSPKAPSLVSPVNCSTANLWTPDFLWSKSEIAVSYIIQVAVDSLFSTVVFTDSLQYTTCKSSTVLTENTCYYWRVRASNMSGTSSWSPVCNFVTAKGLSAPVLVSPTNKTLNEPVQTVFLWDSVNGADNYHVQVASDTSFGKGFFYDTVINVLSKQVVLPHGGNFYWRVSATNANGSGPWSEIWSVSSIVAPPAPVVLCAPVQGDTVRTASVIFNWKRENSLIRKFWVELASDSEMTTLILADTSVTDTSLFIKGLLDNNSYWWRVRACNIAGWGEFSSSRKFTMKIEATHALKNHVSVANACIPGFLLSYSIPCTSPVSIRICDMQGKLVYSKIKQMQNAGTHTVKLSEKIVAPGVYNLIFTNKDFVFKRNFVVLK